MKEVDLQLRTSDEVSSPTSMSLEVDKLLDSTSDVHALLSWQITKKADEVGIRGAESSDVVPLVVGVCARESLTSRERSLEVLWSDHLDAIVVIWLDDGRDIEICVTIVALESDLAEHTWDILSALGDRVPVANPGVWEGSVG